MTIKIREGVRIMNDYMAYLAELIPERDSLRLVKTEAEKYYPCRAKEP